MRGLDAEEERVSKSVRDAVDVTADPITLAAIDRLVDRGCIDVQLAMDRHGHVEECAAITELGELALRANAARMPELGL